MASLYSQEDSWYSFLLETESTPRNVVPLKEICQLKNSMTSSGIELTTFRFVAQYLYQLLYRVAEWTPEGVLEPVEKRQSAASAGNRTQTSYSSGPYFSHCVECVKLVS
jgi:hypothetical protein